LEEVIFVSFGLIFGSFLNVLIYRLPLEQSIVMPGSHCTKCGVDIKFYDNIPVLSYIILLGKCRNCRTRISLRYPIVELITSFTFLFAYLEFGQSLIYTFFSIIFLCMMIALAFIDFDHMILPDGITIGGSILFFIFSFFNPITPTINLIITGAVAFLLFWGIYFFYLKVRKLEGLGQGDIKMVLLMGLFLGVNKFIIAVLLASFLGLLTGVVLIIFKKKSLQHALPFGTFLGIGSYISLFKGEIFLQTILQLYN